MSCLCLDIAHRERPVDRSICSISAGWIPPTACTTWQILWAPMFPCSTPLIISRWLQSAATIPSPHQALMPARALWVQPASREFLQALRRRAADLSVGGRQKTFAFPVSLVQTAISVDLPGGNAADRAAITYSHCRVRMASKPRLMEISCLWETALLT